jgi:hypothetical protein
MLLSFELWVGFLTQVRKSDVHKLATIAAKYIFDCSLAMCLRKCVLQRDYTLNLEVDKSTGPGDFNRSFSLSDWESLERIHATCRSFWSFQTKALPSAFSHV